MSNRNLGPVQESVTYSIGEVREKTGLTSRQIRYYEQMGLIQSLRTDGKHRRFTEETIRKLLKIKELLKVKPNIEAVRTALEDMTEDPYYVIKNELQLPYNVPGLGRHGLTSLYPVSNRADLLALINKLEKNGK